MVTFIESNHVVVYDVSAEMYREILCALGNRQFPHRYESEALEMPQVIEGVSPAVYKKLLEALGDYRLRHVYGEGRLEMMSPRKDHDRIKKLLARLIEHMSFEKDMLIQSVGSTTITSESHDTGVEPDEAYYLANEPAVRDKELYDPSRDPPPDLFLEVDVTSNSQKRMKWFAALGVPEVWQHDGDELHFYELREGAYRPIQRNLGFPWVAPGDMERFLELRTEMDENSVMREFIKWLREQPDVS